MLQTSSTRLAIWLVPVLAAIILLTIWLSQPALDLRVPSDPANPLQNPTHFLLIVSVGVIALGLGTAMSNAAERRQDARVLLIAIGTLSSAASVALHALATPNILVQGRNIGFVLAAPVGLVIASVFSLAASFELSPAQARFVVARQTILRYAVLLFWVIFGVLALRNLPPFDRIPPIDAETFDTPLLFCLIGQTPFPELQYPTTAIVLLAAACFGFAGLQFLNRFRKRPTTVLLGLSIGFVTFAVTTLNLGLSRTWHLTWWQWHVLLLLGYGLLAFSVFLQYRAEGSARVIFDSVYLEETVKKIRQEYSNALEALVAGFERRAAGDEQTERLPVEVSAQFGLTDSQVRVLEQAAAALAAEREQINRLGALVHAGQEMRVIQEEGQLLRRTLETTGRAFRRDELRIGLLQEGRLDFPAELRAGASLPVADAEARRELIRRALREGQPSENGAMLVLPLTVKGRTTGVLEVQRAGPDPFAERDRSILRSLANQLSVALENARLYRQIDVLFRQYMPASVATALLADPSQAALGGEVREISVMFGDLRGFTSLSERLSPPELVQLLNRYYGAASVVVLEQGGTIDKFMGDAMMALFNAPSHQPDHALRACRAALAMQRVVAPIAAEAGDMPRFGIGINTGPALVGNIGSEAIRNYTAIGDTVNLSARLQTRADAGQVLISGQTYALVRELVQVQPLGEIQVKGKSEAVRAFQLLAVAE